MIKYTKKMPDERQRARKSLFSARSWSLLTPKVMGVVSLFVIVAAALTMYVVQVNALATRGFDIRQLEDQIVQLQEEQRHLQRTAIELQSMQSVQQRLESIGFVRANTIYYLNAQGETVVQR